MAHVRIAVTLGFFAAAACGGKLVSDGQPEPYEPEPTTTVPTSRTIPTSTATTTPYPWPTATTSPAYIDGGPWPEPEPYPYGGDDAGSAPPVSHQPFTLQWQSRSFTTDYTDSICSGGLQYVAYNSNYDLWVGAALCTSTQYKLYLGASSDGVFHEIVDWAGSGEDHCELVNPLFTNPSEDDITAACPSCGLGPINWTWPGPYQIYSRGWFGDAFTLETWPQENNYSPNWYECGVAIPQ